MADFLSENYLPWIVGFAFSVGVAWPVTGWTSRKMWAAVDLGPDDRPSPWQPVALGLTERPLFTAAILSGNPGFIAVWLALKTAASWSSWGVDHPGTTRVREITGREVYVNFMLGQAISLAFAASGAFVVRLLERERVAPAALMMLATIAGSLALGWWIEHQGRKYLMRFPMRP